MKYNNSDQLERMRELMSYGMNESIEPQDQHSCVEYSMVAADGKTYGIVRENRKFYIKVAPKKNTKVLTEDYDYIGGENNKKDYEYASYNEASKHFDLKMSSINEANQEKKVRISQFNDTPDSEWQDLETKEMREDINRFKGIVNNVQYILSEDKSGLTMAHTLPEAPASNPSKKEVNSPFTDTAVANGDKDFKTKAEDHKKNGTPFTQDGEVSNSDMESDKAEKGNGGDTYSEKAKFVPDNAVADKKPSGGKVTRADESKKRKHTIRITEEQALAWSKSKDFMDKSQGTEIGDSAPYDENAKGENLEEDYSYAGFDDYDDFEPYSDDFSEFDFKDDFIPVDKKAERAAKRDITKYEPDPDEEEEEFDEPYDDSEMDADEPIELGDDSIDFDGEDDYDEPSEDIEPVDNSFRESRRFRGNRLSEGTKLNDFGKHPAYRKKPMTTPPNTEVSTNGARDWNDDSAKGEQPFGQQIGKGTPYNEKVIDMITDAVMERMGFSRKA
jgi:hypothetical protein